MKVNGKSDPSNFSDNDDLYVGAGVVAVADGTATENGASTDALHDTYIQDAEETTRDDIAVVTGEGDILGVWVFNGDTYAFRNNVGSTKAIMYKATTSGWAAQDLGESLAFTSGGTTEIEEDDVITGAISGATATVKRVILTSGTWAGGDAAGTFILYSQSGTFQAENVDVGASTNLATIAGNSSENTLQPSGRFDFVNYNFYGSAQTKRMYGCDGVSKGFEWDGSTFVPITTGMTTDTPIHVAAHKKHLFFAFPNGSVQHSSIGIPYIWSPVLGASEIGTADEVTGLLVLPGDVLAIFNRDRTYLLYGTSSANWNLVTYTDESGAIEWTIQRLFNPMYLDDRGITSLATVQAYGDFQHSTLSQLIQPLIDDKKGLVTASVRVKSKNQYRIFFSDNSGIIITFAGMKVAGFTRVDYGIHVACCCSGEDSNGNEVMFFGSDDGYVYQMDSGTSLDGSEVEAFLRLAYYHYDSPTMFKQFRRLQLELIASSNITLNVAVDFGYGDTTIPSEDETALSIDGGGGFWNIANWNEFNWSSQITPIGEVPLHGIGTNMGIFIYSNATYEEPHTLQGATVHYSPRRIRR